MSSPTPRKLSEEWFEQYLRERGYGGWDQHEPDLGVPERPDYLVAAGEQQAVCEVKEFTSSPLHRTLTGPHRGYFSTGPREEHGPIRSKVRDAAKQLRGLDGRGWPLVVVLANPNGIWVRLDPEAVEGAIDGIPTFGGPVDPATGGLVTIGRVRGRDGKPTLDHQYISAVAVLERRTHAQDHDEAWRQRTMPELRARYSDRQELMVAILAAHEDKPDGPAGHYHRVLVYHTRAALRGRAVKVPRELLTDRMTAHFEPRIGGFYERTR